MTFRHDLPGWPSTWLPDPTFPAPTGGLAGATAGPDHPWPLATDGDGSWPERTDAGTLYWPGGTSDDTSRQPALAEPASAPRSVGPLLAAAAAGGAVALALGTYGRAHQATGGNITTFGFPTVLAMKAWLSTAVFVLALAQLTSALAMWSRLPGVRSVPRWLPFLHRWTGTTAFVVSLPVAYHCLWSLGFEDTSTRVLVHAVAGCAFYGAMTTKLLSLRIQRLPGLALPIIGGLLVTCLTVIWLTSSLWFFTNVGFPGV